jgi:hypothetical protein
MMVVAIGWMYVVLMMSVAEATSPQGTVLGAVFTFVGYGVLPLALLLYILNTPGRKRALRRRAAEEKRAGNGSPADRDGGGHAARPPVASEGEEP